MSLPQLIMNPLEGPRRFAQLGNTPLHVSEYPVRLCQFQKNTRGVEFIPVFLQGGYRVETQSFGIHDISKLESDVGE